MSFNGAIDIDSAEAMLAQQDTITARYMLYNGDVELLYDSKMHSYMIEREGKHIIVPGVTSITGSLDKPALLPWAVKMAAEYLLAKALKASYLKDGDPLQRRLPDMDIDQHTKWVTESKANYRIISKTALDIGHLAHQWLEHVQMAAIHGHQTVQQVADSGRILLPVVNPDTYLGMDDSLIAMIEREAADNTKAIHNCCKAAVEWMIRHNFRPLSVENKVYSRFYNYAGTFDDIALVNSCGDMKCCSVLREGGIREPLKFTDLKVLSDWKSSKGMYDEYRFQTAAYKAAWEEEYGEELGGRIVVKLGKEDGQFASFFLHNDDQHKDFGGFLGLMAAYERVNEVKALDNAEKDILRIMDRKKREERKLAEKAASDAAKAAAKALKAAEKKPKPVTVQ